MLFLVLIFLLPLVTVWWLHHMNADYFVLALCKRVKTADSTPLEEKVAVLHGKTIFGNNFDVLDMNPETIFNFTRAAKLDAKGKNYLWHFLRAPMLNVVRAEDAEEIFQSTALITKNVVYDLLKPFLGDGLLISTDQKWHFRRKTLTPAFHFNVLQSFLEIFKEESHKLVALLMQKIETELILAHVIPQFTLNNICETALGVKLDDIEGSARYRDAIHAIERVIIQRICNPLMYFVPYFYLFGDYKTHKVNLKIAHDFSSGIIKKKRAIYQQQRQQQQQQQDQAQFQQQHENSAHIFGKKKRYAMLDTLLAAEAEGLIDHEGICDEVNTFMFEGYDTTSTCLIFALLMLAVREDVQVRCHSEISELPPIDELSVFDFNKLEYLECVLKETLRMYPSVPFIGRKCVEECVVNGLIMPKDAQINIHIFDIMRDPRHFTQPNEFKPERFLAEHNTNRHPFAFVPFSAGHRNCIGQKFAILEMKVLLVTILRHFKLLPVTRLEDVILENGIVLRSQQKVKVKLIKRELSTLHI